MSDRIQIRRLSEMAIEDDPEDLRSDAWAGVIPMPQIRGEPVPASDLAPGMAVPDYLSRT